MNVNAFGSIFLSPNELFEEIYSGKIVNTDDIFLDDVEEITKFNNSVKNTYSNISLLKNYQNPSLTIEEFDKTMQQHWFMPNDYFPELISWLYDQCTTTAQRQRVDEELTLFIKHELLDLLFYLKYLVDTMRKNNIVWGVGRGSSVSSYVLFLIGVHKIDSLKYELDINEFIK